MLWCCLETTLSNKSTWHLRGLRKMALGEPACEVARQLDWLQKRRGGGEKLWLVGKKSSPKRKWEMCSKDWVAPIGNQLHKGCSSPKVLMWRSVLISAPSSTCLWCLCCWWEVIMKEQDHLIRHLFHQACCWCLWNEKEKEKEKRKKEREERETVNLLFAILPFPSHPDRAPKSEDASQ